eukprot:CAMPEP_0197679238 /NCGR_PEP_ID=MMETSP1338-20131121/91370_1 /TAXON_ID=43686 ORGANISM="Pelagodinium beii, Strain RCC1491" /NCGR_SAMPLE_ID=MMETSP1338 /ASSEMBLY_ACC=CAM_ASM_000754 /LENGTH=113 /DNA_ID=CAMNT_0043260273 /DNA_START=271 /DNA_END=613 /DNA_ORIENTATION=-
MSGQDSNTSSDPLVSKPRVSGGPGLLLRACRQVCDPQLWQPPTACSQLEVARLLREALYVEDCRLIHLEEVHLVEAKAEGPGIHTSTEKDHLANAIVEGIVEEIIHEASSLDH